MPLFMKKNLSEQKCMLLSCVVIVSFLLLPFLPFGASASRVLMLFYTSLMLTAPFFFSRERPILRFLIGTAILLALLQTLSIFFSFRNLSIMRNMEITQDLICLSLEIFWVAYVLRSSILIKKFNEPVFGCILAYLLLGTVFGNIYYTISVYIPESFYCASSSVSLTHSDMLYFSFITLSTCGFGDIVPIVGIARTAAALETVCGVMYVALFIGRVISDNTPKKTEST